MPIGTIHQIPRREAFSSPEDASVLAHVFTSYGVPLNEFQKLYKEILTSGTGSLGLSRPLWVAPIDLGDFNIPEIQLDAFPGKNGEIVVYQQDYDLKSPQSCFIYLSTPYHDGERTFPDAETFLERIRGFFCLLFGRNFLYQKIISAKIDLNPSGKILTTKNLKICALADGPYPYKENLHELEEIVQALAAKKGDERTRIESAIHYFSRGLEDNDVFLFLWTALEMLCGNEHNHNKAEYILKNLREIYPKTDINQIFGFKKLESLRNDWSHKGIIPNINHDAVRYLQLMFLDILRYKLGLQARLYLQGAISSGMFNLSDINLASNSLDRDRPLMNRAASVEEMQKLTRMMK